MSSQHKRPLAAFFVVMIVCAFVIGHAVRAEAVRQLVAVGVPSDVVAILAPDVLSTIRASSSDGNAPANHPARTPIRLVSASVAPDTATSAGHTATPARKHVAHHVRKHAHRHLGHRARQHATSPRPGTAAQHPRPQLTVPGLKHGWPHADRSTWKQVREMLREQRTAQAWKHGRGHAKHPNRTHPAKPAQAKSHGSHGSHGWHVKRH